MPRFIDIDQTLSAAAAMDARNAIGAHQVFDATAYGAVGDGVTDDTVAMNAAIAAASAAGGTVLLPSGYNFLVTTLVPLSDVTIRGYGATLTKKSSGTNEIITNRGDFTPFSNFKVFGVNFVGEGQSFGDTSLGTSERRQAIGLYDCSNVTVQDCTASDFAYGGFLFVNAIGVRVVNNILTDCGKAPLGNAIHVGYAGASPTADFDTVITGNTVTGCETAACCIQGAGANAGNFPKLAHIHHNNFTCSSFAAIALEIGNSGASTQDFTVRRVVIDHNFCTQTGAAGSGVFGIVVSDNNGGSYSTDPNEFMSICIDHNDIVSSDAGIGCNASNAIIDHNNIICGDAGIKILNSPAHTPANTVVDSNTISMAADSSGHGIYAGGVNYPMISNNKVFWPSTGVTATTSGITVQACGWPIVQNNEVSWAAAHGLLFNGSSNVRCQGNIVYNASSSGSLSGNGIQWISATTIGQNWILNNVIIDDRDPQLMNYPFNNASANNGNLRLNGNSFYALTRNVSTGTAPLELKNVVTIPAGDVVGTTATQTLTNKTLSSPRVDTLLDTNGARALLLTNTASAVNYFEMLNTGTGLPLQLRPGGLGDANVTIQLRPRGTGTITITDSSSAPIATFDKPASPVNYWRFNSSATGTALTATALGTDSAVSINLVPKGAGTVQANGNPVGVKVAVPANASATGVVGQWAADASWLYVCTATNTWVRAALASW